MPKKSKKRGNRSITTHRKKSKVSRSVTTTNSQPLPSHPSLVQQVTVDNGDSSIDSALRLRSTIKPPACNDADKEMYDIIINDAVVRHTCIDINNSNKDSIKSTLSSYGSRCNEDIRRLIRDDTTVVCSIDIRASQRSYTDDTTAKFPSHWHFNFGHIDSNTLPSRSIGKKDTKVKPTVGYGYRNNRVVASSDDLLLPSSIISSDITLQLDKESLSPVYKIDNNDEYSIIRIGDYLSHDEIIACINICNGNYYNLCNILSMSCISKYLLWINRRKSSKYDQPPDEDYLAIIQKLADDMQSVMVVMLPKKKENGGIRQLWGSWNPFCPEYDHLYSEEMKIWRRNIRQKYISDRRIDSSDVKIKLEEMALFCYFMILFGSELLKDEQCERVFYKLINNRHDPLSFLQILQKVSYGRMFDYLSNLYKDVGSTIYNKKAQAMMIFLVTLQTRYGGKVPIDYKILQSLPNLDHKKVRVSLNGYGLYFGVGGDGHCLTVVSTLIRTIWKGSPTLAMREKRSEKDQNASIEKTSQQVLGYITKASGYNFNDDFGEIAQQLGRGKEVDRKWAKETIALLAKKNDAFADVMDRVYKKYKL